MELARKVERAIKRGDLLRAGQRVAVACSGGADSVALLRLLAELRERLGLQLLVCHLNHQLRGAEADGDEEFVRGLADELGLRFISQREDVAARAESNCQNLEEAARDARMEFFASLIGKGEADVVAVGHSLDDQAETLLQRMVRGTGTRGLAGIYPVVDKPGELRMVRPLLGVRREELRAYLRGGGQIWREDTTNRDRGRLRNRIRLDLLSELNELNEAAIENLGRLASQAREDESFWQGAIETVFSEAVEVRDESAVLRLDAWQELANPGAQLPGRAGEEAARAVLRRLVRRTVGEVRGDLRRISGAHVESVVRLAIEGQSGGRVELPGLVVERRFGELHFLSRLPTLDGGARDDTYNTDGEAFEMELKAPGMLTLPSGGGLRVARVEAIPSQPGYNDMLRNALDAERVGFPLLVRSWRPGDRYRPRTASRERKLKELFQRGRVPAPERRQCPVVLSQGEIIWTARFGPSAGCALGRDGRKAICIEETAGP